MSLLDSSSEVVELVAWRSSPVFAIAKVTSRKCHFSKRFGNGHYLHCWITQKVVSIYITLNLICIRKIVLLLESWAKSSNLNLFFYAFLHIFCVINITVAVEFLKYYFALVIKKFHWEHFLVVLIPYIVQKIFGLISLFEEDFSQLWSGWLP